MRNTYYAQEKLLMESSEDGLGLKGQVCTIHSQYQSLFQNALIRKSRVGTQQQSYCEPPKSEQANNDKVKCIDLRQFAQKSVQKGTTAITYSDFKQKSRFVREQREKREHLEKEGCILPCPVQPLLQFTRLDKIKTLKDLADECPSVPKISVPVGSNELKLMRSNKSSTRIKLRRMLRRSVIIGDMAALTQASEPIKVDGTPVKTEAGRVVRHKRISAFSLKHASLHDTLVLRKEKATISPQKVPFTQPSDLTLSRTLHSLHNSPPPAQPDHERLGPWRVEF